MSFLPTIWRRPFILILAIPLVAACSSLTRNDAPGCVGARRPANPHGSVLTSEASATIDAPAASAGLCRGGRR